jgi:hypothetical protein
MATSNKARSNIYSTVLMAPVSGPQEVKQLDLSKNIVDYRIIANHIMNKM